MRVFDFIIQYNGKCKFPNFESHFVNFHKNTTDGWKELRIKLEKCIPGESPLFTKVIFLYLKHNNNEDIS